MGLLAALLVVECVTQGRSEMLVGWEVSGSWLGESSGANHVVVILGNS